MSIAVEISAAENNSGYGMALNNAVQLHNTTDNNEMYNMQIITIAKTVDNSTFILQPDESKSISMIIELNNEKFSSNENTGNLANIKNINYYKYELRADVKVEGVSLDPHAKQKLDIT